MTMMSRFAGGSISAQVAEVARRGTWPLFLTASHGAAPDGRASTHAHHLGSPSFLLRNSDFSNTVMIIR
jgi:hypothetical protein